MGMGMRKEMTKGQYVRITCKESVHKGEVGKVYSIDIHKEKTIVGVVDSHDQWIGRYYEEDLEVVE